LRLFSFGGYGLALAALALVVFGAYESYPNGEGGVGYASTHASQARDQGACPGPSGALLLLKGVGGQGRGRRALPAPENHRPTGSRRITFRPPPWLGLSVSGAPSARRQRLGPCMAYATGGFPPAREKARRLN